MSQQDDIYIRNNVLSVLDVASMLSVSKQRVTRLIKDGKITPARVDHPILFSRSEVERYLDEQSQSEFVWKEPKDVQIPQGQRTFFFPSREHQNQAYVDMLEYLPYLQGIAEVWLFQSEEEAAWAGFYQLGVKMAGKYYGYEAPSMVMVGNNQNQLWLKSFTCGSDSAGARATLRILRILVANGYIGKISDLEKSVLSSPAIHLEKKNERWTMQDEQSQAMIRDARLRILWEKRGIKTVADENRLLLLVPDMDGTRTPKEKVELLRIYDVYLNDPQCMTFHQHPEDAHANNTYAPDLHGNLTTYQVTITCKTENGMWFQTVDPGTGIGIGKSPDVMAIMEHFRSAELPASYLNMSSVMVPLPSFVEFYEQESKKMKRATITKLPKR